VSAVVGEDQLVLAALARAERHRTGPSPGVTRWAVCDHLAVTRRSRAARELRVRLPRLVESGLLDASRVHGMDVWHLTEAGRRLAADAAGVVLPESPQHRVWREAQDTARVRQAEVRRRVIAAVQEVSAQLERSSAVACDEWLLAADRLSGSCRLMASVAYCLGEWEEPDDVRADVDDCRGVSDLLASDEELARVGVLRSGRRRLMLSLR